MNIAKIDHQRRVADYALNMISLADPFAIVAGGAPRDWYFGKEASDIDLFFSVKENIPIGVVQNMLKTAGFKNTVGRFAEGLPEWYKLNPSIKVVFDTEIEGVPVQLILVRDSTFKVVKQFPLSICKVWYKNGKTTYEKDFIRSVQHKAIYKTNELYARGHVYLQKILGKFPDYKYYDNVTELALDILDKP